MKKQLLILFGACFTVLVFNSNGGGPFQFGAGNRTGSAGSVANCSTGSGCHDANNSNLGLTITLLDNWTPVTSYQGGKTYRVLITGIAQGTTRAKFGFQLSSVRAAATSTQAGALGITGRSGVALRTSSSPHLIEHSSPLNGTSLAGNYVDTVTVNWTATAGQGPVRFYATMNAVNGNGTTSGDMPNTAFQDFPEATTGVAGFSHTLNGLYPNPATSTLNIPLGAGHADISIFDAMGRNLKTQKFSMPNSSEASMNVENLPAGQYFVQVIQNGTKLTAQFSKL